MLKQIGILAVLFSGCAAQGENDFDDNVIEDNVGGQTSVQQTGGAATGGATSIPQATGGQNIVSSTGGATFVYVNPATGGRTQTTTTSVSTGGFQGTGSNASTGGNVSTSNNPKYCFENHMGHKTTCIDNGTLFNVPCETQENCLIYCSGQDTCSISLDLNDKLQYLMCGKGNYWPNSMEITKMCDVNNGIIIGCTIRK